MKDLLILPIPAKMKFTDETYRITPDSIAAADDSGLKPVLERFADILSEFTGVDIKTASSNEKSEIRFIKNNDIPCQGYKLTITLNGITVIYDDFAGAFYAVSTLKHIIMQCGANLPCVEIEDAPDLQRRGLLLDISRGKVPKLETIYKIIDLIADLKLNELQLYIEGFTFAYPSFPEVWKGTTPITADDFKTIEAYCKARFIDLVPNQNSYGHMDAWMNHPDFRKYAECPDGYINEEGNHVNPGTLGATDPEAMSFLNKLYNDFLPIFSSEYVNIGGDETYDVGLGKSAAIKEKGGTGQAYLAGLINVYNLAKEYNKKIMFWGDIVMKYPELVPELPKDIIPMEWGYEWDSPYDEDTKKYSTAGLRYYVCPGTSSWNSILGRTDNMLGNIYNAVSNGLENGAYGMLTTDWGDGGTWQYLPISYPGFVYSAAASWGAKNNKDADTALYLSRFIFKDKGEKLGKALMDIGNCYKHIKARIWNQTWLNAMASMPHTEISILLPNFSVEECENTANDLRTFISSLNDMQPECEDGETVLGELKNGARLALNACEYSILQLELAMGKSIDDEVKAKCAALNSDLKAITDEHKRLWLIRNKYSGIDDSINRMLAMSRFYESIK